MIKLPLIKATFLSALLVILSTYLISIIPFRFGSGKAISRGITDFDLYDLYYANKKHDKIIADNNIVIVELGMDRAEIANQLKVIRRYEPKLVALDATFEELRDSATDKSLAEETNKTNNLVYAFGIDKTHHAVPNVFYNDLNNASAGYVDFSSKADDAVIRTYTPFIKIEGKDYEAFTSTIIRKANKEKYEKLKERNNKTESINYAGNLDNFLNVTRNELNTLDSQQLATLLRNKIVLLGYFVKGSSLVMEDLHYSPFNTLASGKNFPDMYGVVIHANILSMILKGNFATLAQETTVYSIAFAILFFINLLFISKFKRTFAPNYFKFILIQLGVFISLLIVFLIIYVLFLYKIQLQPIVDSMLLNAVWAFVYYRSKKLISEKHILEEEVATRTAELRQSLDHLKTTQAQLIQKEKMASLGELTAGVAHEIQNPLNFINNFSDVNNELIEELKDELKAGNAEEALAIADDIKQNGLKVNHHGKRADAIVKIMLLHARSSTGEKEPTDVNRLVDEYFHLTYQAFVAKNKDFKVKIQTQFDSRIEKVLIVPQEIGRVLMNLYNNAFYSMAEKQGQQNGGYEPAILATTQMKNSELKISIRDNGTGINEKISSKIFQPFFTTKPTGEGTGLGLSLSYDIIKTQGGELKVDTREGEYAEFIILLAV